MEKCNDDIIEELIESYSSLIRSVCRKYYLAGGTEDDLFQEGMIGLFEAYNSFDKTKGDYFSENFKSFAILCIKRQIIDALKRANAKKNAPLNNYVSFSREDFSNDDNTLDEGLAYLESPDAPLENVIDREALDEKIQSMIKGLSAYEKKVIELYLEGLTQKKIASLLDKDVKSIYNCIERIKQKSREGK
ncbi:MAG: sigma-70 family RNA polymerase sigma factor [Clostridia bacterium]|nr:sigma-70 family RNA polymerase sigma factor [Clostridia bacterium]